jgi:general stress protein 26
MLFDVSPFMVFAVGALAAVAGASEFAPSVDAALRTAKEIHVATQRDDGTRSSAAPVWFMYDGEAIYFSTGATSHKARRLRDGGTVYVAVGGANGPSFEGHGTLVSDPALIESMGQHYRDKYWIAWLGFFVPRNSRVSAGKTVIVKVVPRAPAP